MSPNISSTSTWDKSPFCSSNLAESKLSVFAAGRIMILHCYTTGFTCFSLEREVLKDPTRNWAGYSPTAKFNLFSKGKERDHGKVIQAKKLCTVGRMIVLTHTFVSMIACTDSTLI